MTYGESRYLALAKVILEQGDDIPDRTGTGTRSLFGERLYWWLDDGFPLLTTKKVSFKSIVHELLWFIKGSTNVRELQKHGVHIWDEWAMEDGELGPIYGAQWRDWKPSVRYPAPDNYPDVRKSVDQLAQLIEGIKTNPHGRRHIVSAWNVGELSNMKLPPCHILFQCYVRKGQLDLQMYQRSADFFLGVPFNIASYALLTMMLAQVCGLQPGRLIHVFGDVHIYTNHFEQVRLQLSREPRALPRLVLNPGIDNIDGFTYDDIKLEGYDPHPAIKGDVSV